MPEGVEVKISADLIKPLVIGKQVRRIAVGADSRYNVHVPKGYVEFEKSFITKGDINVIEKCTITDVQTHGKFMYWTFDNGWYMFSTFGMTGQWSPIPGNHVCFEMKLIDYNVALTSEQSRSEIYFNDPRHFGTIQFTNCKAVLDDKLNELGWDPLQSGMDETLLKFVAKTCSKSNKPIGQVLMDQKVFAGVGNYIRAEALYAAKMSPWRVSSSISKGDMNTLCQAIVDIMNDSYKHQGATILTYADAYGAEGKYSGFFKVYGQKTDPLGNKIIKEDTPEGRTIHWCPAVQV